MATKAETLAQIRERRNVAAFLLDRTNPQEFPGQTKVKSDLAQALIALCALDIQILANTEIGLISGVLDPEPEGIAA